MIFPPEGKRVKVTLTFWDRSKMGSYKYINLASGFTDDVKIIVVSIVVSVTAVISLSYSSMSNAASHWTDKAWGFLEDASQCFLKGGKVYIYRPEWVYADTEHSFGPLTYLHFKTSSLNIICKQPQKALFWLLGTVHKQEANKKACLPQPLHKYTQGWGLSIFEGLF